MSGTGVLVGKPAPDFRVQGFHDGGFREYTLAEFRGQWVYLLFYPADFTFVCPTEVLAFSKAAAAFERKHCQVLGLSVDAASTHQAWVQAGHEEGGLGGSLDFPLLADVDRHCARAFGVLSDEGVALRGLFLVDPSGTVLHATIHHLAVGRSVREAMRVLDAFQFVAAHEGKVCPADWSCGEGGMDASTEGVRRHLASLGGDELT